MLTTAISNIVRFENDLIATKFFATMEMAKKSIKNVWRKQNRMGVDPPCHINIKDFNNKLPINNIITTVKAYFSFLTLQ